MPENTGVLQARNPDGTFPPGVSGNPAGKPLGTRHMTTKIMEAIVKVADGESSPEDILIVRTLLQKARSGDMRAIEIVLNYVDGKPLQGIDLTTLGQSLNRADEVIAAISSKKRG